MQEYAGFRVLLKMKIASTYTTIAGIEDLDGPEPERDMIDVSHRTDGSVANAIKKFTAGMLDEGEMSFSVVFDPDEPTHDPTLSTSVPGLLASGAQGDFQIIFPGVGTATTIAQFYALIKGWKVKAPLEDGLTADVTMQLNSAPVWSHQP